MYIMFVGVHMSWHSLKAMNIVLQIGLLLPPLCDFWGSISGPQTCTESAFRGQATSQTDAFCILNELRALTYEACTMPLSHAPSLCAFFKKPI